MVPDLKYSKFSKGETTTIINPSHIINVYYLTIPEDIMNSFTSENWANRITGNQASLNGSTTLTAGTVMVACDRTNGKFYWITTGPKTLKPNYPQVQRYVTVNGVEQPGEFLIEEGDIVRLKFKSSDYEYEIHVVYKEAGYVFSPDTIETRAFTRTIENKPEEMKTNVAETASVNVEETTSVDNEIEVENPVVEEPVVEEVILQVLTEEKPVSELNDEVLLPIQKEEEDVEE